MFFSPYHVLSPYHVECHLLQNESSVLVLILHSQNIPGKICRFYRIHDDEHHLYHHHHDQHQHHHHHHHHHHLHFHKVGESKLSKGKEDEDKTADDVDVQSRPIGDLRKYNFIIVGFWG